MGLSKDKYRKMAQKVKNWNEGHKTGGGGNLFNLPQGVEFFTPTESKGKERTLIDIIPYEVTVDNHPQEIPKGDAYWTRTYLRHRNIGPNKVKVICPRTIGKPCPICEYREAEIKEKGYDKDYDPLKAQVMDLFNVVDLNNVEKGVQLFSYSYASFGKLLGKELDSDPELTTFIIPTTDGKSLKIRFDEETFGGGGKNKGGKFLAAGKIDFIERDEDIPDDILEKALDLDNILIIKSYEEIEKIFLGVEETEPGKDGEPVNHEETTDGKKSGGYGGYGKKKPKEEDEEEEKPKKSKSKDEEEDEKPKKSAKKEEDEEEEKPKKSKSKDEEEDEKPKKGKSKDEEEDEKPKKSSGGKCPHGHKFGVDTNKKPECDDCDIKVWNLCSDEKTRIQKEKE